MVDTVNVIVTCTKDKRFVVEPDCELRTLGKGPMSNRIREWQRRLSGRNRERVKVDQLYAGDHWSVVQSLRSTRFGIEVWVCSAGYGLVSMGDKITPYSATFTPTHADSVCRNVSDCAKSDAPRTWWRGMTKWKAHTRRHPRSLQKLAEHYPNRAMLVVASEVYLRAIADDLRAALDAFSDPNLLSIVSSGSRTLPGLTQHLVPCDARLQRLVNGARGSLNTRIAAKILTEARNVPRLSTLKRRFQKLLAQQPEMERYDRTPLSDKEVRRFITASLRKDENLRHTRLLRMLRDRGNACEQSRFASLYREVQEQRDDNSKEI